MRKKLFKLTKGEEKLMGIFWDAGHPMTSMELSEGTDEFNFSYIHRLLTSLQKKEMLKVEGFVKSGKQYARTFIPTITREEYGALLMDQLGIKSEKALARLSVAFVEMAGNDREEDKENLVRELEKIIEQLKENKE